MKRLMRGAFIASLAIGCSGSSKPVRQPEVAPAGWGQQKKEAEAKKEVSCLKRAKGIQECLVEKAFSKCKKDRECVDEELKHREDFPGKERKLSLVVGEGDEVFSMLIDEGTLVSIAKLSADTIDLNGVDFSFTHQETNDLQLDKMQTVTEASFRMNYDGSTSGDYWAMNSFEIWDFSVEGQSKGARVKFSTSDPRITVRE